MHPPTTPTLLLLALLPLTTLAAVTDPLTDDDVTPLPGFTVPTSETSTPILTGTDVFTLPTATTAVPATTPTGGDTATASPSLLPAGPDVPTATNSLPSSTDAAGSGGSRARGEEGSMVALVMAVAMGIAGFVL